MNYLTELKAVCAKDAKVMEGLCRKVMAMRKKNIKQGYSTTHCGNEYWSSNVYGDIVNRCNVIGDGKHRIGERRCYGWQKNGIEILNAQPNAKGNTYSNECKITVAHLKEACKKNGIKGITKMDKKALLHALMKC